MFGSVSRRAARILRAISAGLASYGYSRVEKFRTIEHLRAQLTVIRWHLHAAALEHGERKRRHLDGAALTYQGALELLRLLPLAEEERLALTKELAQLKEELIAARAI
jgi:hypothetical protein